MSIAFSKNGFRRFTLHELERYEIACAFSFLIRHIIQGIRYSLSIIQCMRAFNNEWHIWCWVSVLYSNGGCQIYLGSDSSPQTCVQNVNKLGIQISLWYLIQSTIFEYYTQYKMAKKVTAEIVQQSLDKLTIYLSPYLSLANTAMINYIVDDSWTHEIPKSIQSEICSEESALEAINLFWRIHDRSKTTVATDNFNSYSKYLKESEAHSLDALSDLWITPEALKQQLASVSNESGLHVKGYMSEKKAHEVLNPLWYWECESNACMFLGRNCVRCDIHHL